MNLIDGLAICLVLLAEGCLKRVNGSSATTNTTSRKYVYPALASSTRGSEDGSKDASSVLDTIYVYVGPTVPTNPGAS